MTWKEKPNSHLAAEGESHGLKFPLQSYPDDFNLPSCLSALERKKSQHMALSVWISVNSWLIGRDSDAGKDWGQEKKRAIEDEKDEWHYGLNGHEFEETLGVSFSTLSFSRRIQRPGALQSLGSQRGGHDLVAKQQQQHNHTDQVLSWCVPSITPQCITKYGHTHDKYGNFV